MRLRLLLYMWRVLPLPESLRWLITWLFNAHFVAGVAALVCDEQDRVLLFEHTYRGKHPWGLPGGWLGRNEQPEAALARELREESNLEIAVDRIALVDLDTRERHLDFIYRCRITGGTFRPSAEVRAYEYFPHTALPDVHAKQRRQITRALTSS